MKYHLTPVGIVVITKTRKNISEDVKKKKESLHIVDGNANNTKHKNGNEPIKNLEGNT